MRLGIEAVMTLVLAVQAGRLVWLFVEPAAPPATSPAAATAAPVDYSVFQRFDAFFRTGAQGSLAEATAAEGGQMRLYGVRSDGSGGGSAIIGLADGRQVSVAVGETVDAGLVLQSVAADHVVLARGSSLSRLIFSDVPLGAAAPPPPPATPQTVTPQPAAGPAADPAAIAAAAGLRPRMRGLRVDGFTLTGTAEGALANAGLRTGDVVVAVDGQRLDNPARIAGLRDRLSGQSAVELRIERDGQEQTLTLGAQR
ncbi:type II secretion system protein N [Brevundimonas sp.]|uniref:type II secretion system protein N n=1 Tax=Brevundimonas sp. TaxID=1871086 RepID=UPI0035B467A6